MDLNELRNSIDDIDNKILELINKRLEVVKNVGLYKAQTKSSIYRPQRENDILSRLKHLNNGELTDKAIESIFFEIISVARNIEHPDRVGYLGPEGTYTHQAAKARFGGITEYIPMNSIANVFKALHNKEVKFAIVPIENNTDGIVGSTIDSLLKYDVKIVASMKMDIHHSFASTANDIKSIKRIYSHPQGYNQCLGFLDEHFLNNAEFIPTKSTAEAAKMALADSSSAAICPKIAASMNQLPILFERIEDNLANETRFLILSDFQNAKEGNEKTAILAKTSDKAGALLEFLELFKANNINLTKIESRPIQEEGISRLFYIEFEGYYQDENVRVIFDSGYDIKFLGSFVDSGV
ncbi:MAG: Chorismate mutase I (EC / Prephenate dehydratase (EC [uncultured Campylobacterales bacterium]|uniref:Bifunctional chorismate mutase/prephenate dehydratase n=1 Tax=uncultured Campylobacterales bacterium TaxID=352960 RepID=A0A6S6TC99_9BACT|nr:MAG: Chorismate mutase I (EC / Prephenate dehydratase (EC [uncultured Campylobacterales bacterium]